MMPSDPDDHTVTQPSYSDADQAAASSVRIGRPINDTQIPALTEQLDINLSKLGEGLDGLSQRLSSVLQPTQDTADDNGEKSAPDDVVAPHADFLRSTNRRVVRLNRVVLDILARLQV